MSLEEFIKMYGTDGASMIITQLIVLVEDTLENEDLIIEAKSMNKRLLRALRATKTGG